MIDIGAYMSGSKAKKIEFQHGLDEPGIRHGEKGEMTSVYGYDKDGKLLFFAKYNKEGDFRLSLYSHDTQTKEDLYSDEADDVSLSPGRKKQLSDAKKFVAKLKTMDMQRKTQSLADVLQKGIKVKLSPESRLSFAPDIEELQISKDENGFLCMSGISKDGKQRIDFTAMNGDISFELHDGDTARSYNNKMRGEFTWRDLKSPGGTRYFDTSGSAYAKEMAAVMDKVKAQYRNRTQQNIQQAGRDIASDGR